MSTNQENIPLCLNPVVAVYDKKTGLYDPPFSCRHVGEAVRDFGVIQKDAKTKFGQNPQDFDLKEVAEFNYATGEFKNLNPQKTLITGVPHDYVQTNETRTPLQLRS